jgi:cation transport ATPase
MSQPETKKIVLNIGGMSCINCARAIEKALNKLNGVTQATVNLAAEKAIIDYNPNIVNHKPSKTPNSSRLPVIHEKNHAPSWRHELHQLRQKHRKSPQQKKKHLHSRSEIAPPKPSSSNITLNR